MVLTYIHFHFTVKLLTQVILLFSYKYLATIFSCCQGDADYLRYRGMQEFDQAMQRLEEEYEVRTLLLSCKQVLDIVWITIT